jgi:hypothetical protein
VLALRPTAATRGRVADADADAERGDTAYNSASSNPPASAS